MNLILGTRQWQDWNTGQLVSSHQTIRCGVSGLPLHCLSLSPECLPAGTAPMATLCGATPRRLCTLNTTTSSSPASQSHHSRRSAVSGLVRDGSSTTTLLSLLQLFPPPPPGVHSPSLPLQTLRLVKSASELALMRRAGEVAASTFREVG